MRTRRWGYAVGLTGLMVLLGGFAVGRWTRVRYVSLPAPVQEPIRLAVLGDFHIVDESSMRHARACLQRAMEEKPDIILLVGDYVHTHHGLPYLQRTLQGVRAPLGVCALRLLGYSTSRTKPVFLRIAKENLWHGNCH